MSKNTVSPRSPVQVIEASPRERMIACPISYFLTLSGGCALAGHPRRSPPRYQPGTVSARVSVPSRSTHSRLLQTLPWAPLSIAKYLVP